MSESIRQFARGVIEAESAAVARMSDAIDDDFLKAVKLILDCRGAVLTTGMGKAGHIAHKLSATLSSTGTPSHFLSPVDAVHGDVGAVRSDDVLIILSSSGESDEILRLLSIVKKLGRPVIGMTACRTNSLGKFADIALVTGRVEEACPLGLAPSCSTTAMLALADALALTVMQQRKFTAEDFALFHPAGQLGRNLIRVREAMTFRVGENLPVASDKLTVGQVLHAVSTLKRRSGALILVDDDGKMSGLFTDGDLRRIVTDDPRSALVKPIVQVMTRKFTSINGDKLASEAMAMMRARRFDELPVVDDAGKPIGLIDVQDLVVLKMMDVDQTAP